MFELDSDFVEIHIATPYYGTELYAVAQKKGLIKDSVLGYDYFNPPTIGTENLSMNELARIRKKALLTYHIRPSYLLKKIHDVKSNPAMLLSYFKFGIRLLRNNLS
jgi:hypothetical protein